MTGRDHLIAGTAVVGIADGVLHGVSALTQDFLPSQAWVTAYHDMFLQGDGFFAKAGWIVGSAVLFYFGTLLPDIDTGESLIRKILHIRSKKVSQKWHRTWTHCLWPLLLFGLLAWQVPIFFWLCFGYFTHLFLDSFSTMGLCWLYPFQRYRVYPTGAKIANGHKLKLYKNSELSEAWMVVCICVAGVASFSVTHGNIKLSDFFVPLFV